MKLKRILAREFASTETYCDSFFTAENAYLAGFEKARELAYSEATHSFDIGILLMHLAELGEEEVKE